MPSDREHPELGGTPEILDTLEILNIVAANARSFGQMEYPEQGPHATLTPDDPRPVPPCDMLERMYTRYGRRTIVFQTSGLREGRPDWLRDVMQESPAAVNRGIDLHGIRLFPAVDMPDRHTGEWLHNGICDLVDDVGRVRRVRRVPFAPYVAKLHRWQHPLHCVTELDEDPFSDAVELEDVVRAAKRFDVRADRN